MTEQQKIERLLEPRYEVIALMPFLKFKVGDILHRHGCDTPNFNYDWYSVERWGNCVNACDIDKYPHLFKKLSWHERRDISEMPEYVKADDGKIHRVCYHKADEDIFMAPYGSSWDNYDIWDNVLYVVDTHGMTPATLTDYELFTKKMEG